jgi:hypothetical protein
VRPKHTTVSATMIPLQLAKARTPSRTLAALSDTSSGLRSLLQLSHNQRTLCSVYSRASCSWTRNDVARTNRHAVISRPYKQCNIRPASLFSTSTTRRLKLEDETNPAKPSRDDAQVGHAFTLKKPNLRCSLFADLFKTPRPRFRVSPCYLCCQISPLRQIACVLVLAYIRGYQSPSF